MDTTNLPISIEKVAKSRLSEVDFSKLNFGQIFSDHMFICDYKNGQWQDARIVPSLWNLPLVYSTMDRPFSKE